MCLQQWDKKGRGGRPARWLCAASHGLPIRAESRLGVSHPGRAETGFTLVEILVVVGVLAIIVAVVILNITGFTGTGKEDSANAEAHQVQTAVVAYLQAHNLSTWDGIVGGGSSEDVEKYLLNPGRLQARYTVAGGKLTAAIAYADGRWSGCMFDAAAGGWACP